MHWKTLPPVIACLVLAGMAIARHSMVEPVEASSYHAAIRESAKAVPDSIGDWLKGEEVPPTNAALSMLHPNVFINRKYHNVLTGEDASVLLVQCTDAFDMIVHYPPICYTGGGWVLSKKVPRTWTIDGEQISGLEYHFRMDVLGHASSIVVANFMIIPDGPIVPDMEPVTRSAQNMQKRFFGAAQVQVLVAGDMPQNRRDSAVTGLIGGYMPLIHAIRYAPHSPSKE